VKRARVAIGETEETFAIKHELRRLLVALYGEIAEPAIPGTLRDHITRAIDERSRSH
jgi:hypothetical protein